MNQNEAKEKINQGVLLIHCSYKIVKKDETRVLIKTLNECRKIYDAYSVMSYLDCEIMENAKMIELLNRQISRKVTKMYLYYYKKYGLTFESADWGKDNSEFPFEYRLLKTIENNVEHICQSIKSWEK